MRIVVVHHIPASCQRWRDALARELPDAQVGIFSEGSFQDADYAIGWAAPPAAFFEQHPNLKAFFSTGAGVEKLLGSSALPPNIPVIRLEDAGMGSQMADYCVFEVLQWMRRRTQYAEQQRAQIWKQHPAEDKADWPIGVFGVGVLGSQVAAAFAALGFPVNGYSRSVRDDPHFTCFADSGGAGDFAAFIRATRVLVILAPLTCETRDRFDAQTLRLLRPGSYVINVARGELLVDEALIELLDAEHLAGAALDVFRTEPLPAEHAFWKHPQVRITPHVSAITVIGASAAQVGQKIRRLERNEPVSGVVDRARGY